MREEGYNLAGLIDPIGTEEFKRVHWETAPLTIKRDDSKYYHDLLTLADVDKILSLPLRSPRLRILRDGAEHPVGNVTNAEAVYEQFRDGCTVVLQYIHERVPSLARLCRSLAAEISASFQVNAYLTPPDEKGLSVHYDTHDVFVLQIAGVKHWRLYDEVIRLPLPGQNRRPATAAESSPVAEFDLHAGDAIYIPRGFAHDALAADSISLHLTVGVRPITWAFVMLSAIEAAIEQDAYLRESLPMGFAADSETRQAAEARLTELLDTFRQQADVERTIDNAVAAARYRASPSLESHLLDLSCLSQLHLDTRVRRRPTVFFDLTIADGKVELSFHGKTLRMPEFVAVDLEFIDSADDFTARDLPGVLDQSGRLVLMRRLVREGLLTTAPA